MQLSVFDDTPIVLASGYELSIQSIVRAIESVNGKFQSIAERTAEIAFNVFEVTDFRMLSGLLGESLVTEISNAVDGLNKNPNLDGYPDLVDVSKKEYLDDFLLWQESDIGRFIKYPYGGIEVKNTFGTKKQGSQLQQGDKRIGHVNTKLDWKAHHRTTNNLLAVYSDFVDECPQIVAAMYSDELQEEDWAEKQNPKEGSTMTSFSVIRSSGCQKLKRGLLVCLDDEEYKRFFGVEE